MNKPELAALLSILLVGAALLRSASFAESNSVWDPADALVPIRTELTSQGLIFREKVVIELDGKRVAYGF